MQKFLGAVLVGILLWGGSLPAYASIGTGIGIQFPISGGSSSASGGEGETYGAFSFDKMLAELTAKVTGGRLKLTLKITNTGEEPYTINHRNGQEYDMVILDSKGEELYRWSGDQSFTEALTATEYEPHKSVVYTAAIDRKIYRELKGDAALVTAFLTDTPYTITVKVPKAKKSHNPAAIFGTVIVGSGGWLRD
ncbi:MAG: hypothetical protein IJ849_08250 [Selenomonadaceae bacterium]|nr:hypothetical protein [Selenomonadaceae bacterium]